MAYRYVAFFDVDKTILSINSGSAMVRASAREGLTGYRRLAEAAFFTGLHRANILKAETIINRLAGWFTDFDEPVIIDFSSRLFQRELLPAIRLHAREAVAFHRGRKAELVILSASTSYTCSPLVEELGLDGCLCSELEVHAGTFSGKPSTPYCYGNEKLVRAEGFCRERGYDLAEAWYYGDSWSDIPILEAVGHPVCVNPDRKLRKVAKQRKWDISRW